MQISCTVAQFPISLSVSVNLNYIQRVLEHASPGTMVVFPEGSVSGYETDINFLQKVDTNEVMSALKHIQLLAMQRNLLVWAGACYQDSGKWFNSAWGFAPDGQKFIYQKVNLATHERRVFTAGDSLPVFSVHMPEGKLKIGVQLCREIRYPEQWGWLARQGAEIILHLDNAVGDEQQIPVWRSHLVSRAAETQRFVISANNAGEEQKCPTMVISPKGKVLGEVISSGFAELHIEFDTAEISNWYLDQCREDVIKIEKA